MDNVVAIQAAIKQQAEDLRSELADLAAWEDEIKRKDDAIKAKTILPVDLPPVRGTPKDATAKPAAPRVDPVAMAKDQGNEFFKKSEWDNAIRCYTKGIDLDPKSASTHVLYSNRAMCFIKLQQWALAESDASTCIDLNKSFPKGFFRRAVARKALGKLDEARKDLEIVLVLAPGDVEADRELQSVTALIKQRNVTSAPQSSQQAWSAAPKKKIVIQEVDDDDEEEQQASGSAAQADDKNFEETRKAHQENVRLAQLAAEKQQREAAAKAEQQRQAARKSNPRVEMIDEDDEDTTAPAAKAPATSKPEPPKPAPKAVRHEDPTPKPPAAAARAATTTASPSRSVDSLKVPKSFNDFEKTFLDVRNDAAMLDHFLSMLAGSSLPALFGISLSPEYLVDLLRSVSRQTPEKAADLLRGFAQVRRLEELVMFFEDDEKVVVNAALKKASGALTAAEAAKIKGILGL